jgi:hypothetical protein
MRAEVSDQFSWRLRDLIHALEPEGDFALSAERTNNGITIYCAFGREGDAHMLVDALNGREHNAHCGWSSEHHCSLDPRAAEVIADASVRRQATGVR